MYNTNNIAPQATFSASSAYGGWPASQLNDLNNNYGWSSNTGTLPHWVIAYWSTPQVIQKFAIFSRVSNANQAPTNFLFEGSNTGVFGGEQTQLGSWTGLSWSDQERKVFTVSNANAYNYYRIYITDNAIHGYCSFMEVEFYEYAATDSAPAYGSDIGPSSTSQTASSTWSGLSASNLVDGNDSTIWGASANPPGWVQLGFSSGKIVNKIAVRARPDTGNQAPVFAKLLGSNTGSFSGEETLIASLYFGIGWATGERREVEVYIGVQ